MATPLGDILEQAVRRHGISDEVLAARILTATADILKQLIGPDASQFAKAESFRHGEVRVSVRSGVVGVELRRLESEILGRLRRAVPGVRLERLQIRQTT
ncbi:MAG: DUF721 domain-containing protein [Candidatus Kerfeldbacteria bacterium]|nr:DUF721 domain-containing protein [Candidatus Kerfeldbacteria bacterium]